MSNVIERLSKYEGLDFDKQRTPTNPCITVREAIEVADHIASLTAKLAEQDAALKLAAEAFASYALHHGNKEIPDLDKVVRNVNLSNQMNAARSVK